MVQIDAHDLLSCTARFANDGLDSSLDNCQWKRIGDKLWQLPLSGVTISKWDELLVSYDAKYWYGLWSEWDYELRKKIHTRYLLSAKALLQFQLIDPPKDYIKIPLVIMSNHTTRLPHNAIES